MRLVVDLQGAQGANARRGIGRYARELALAMARQPQGHEMILLLNGAMLDTAEALSAQFAGLLPRSNIRTWFPPEPGDDPAFSERAAQLVRAEVLLSLDPDLVHVSSLFEGVGDRGVTGWPAALPRVPQAATLYDLIPLIRHLEYFGPGAHMAPHAAWYQRCLYQANLLDGLLAISESSRREALDHLRVDPTGVFAIGAGINPDFRPPGPDAAARADFLRRYSLADRYILSVGGGDQRKNEAASVEAYAGLPPALLRTHQLVLLGRVDVDRLRPLLDKASVSGGRVHILPFIEEGDLAALYGHCALFVFPSLHEGFGLPPAEAMACGAPVLASNTSSLPEVIGLPDALFDPKQPAEMARSMARVLTDPALRGRLVAHGLQRAAQLVWPASAARAWDALQAIQARVAAQDADRPARLLPRLAFVSPLPPVASGVADYSQALIPVLARHYDITLVTETGDTSAPQLHAMPCLNAATFAASAQQFDRVLYQLGCSEFHSFQFRDLLPHHPGVSVLHDTMLGPLWNYVAHRSGIPDAFLTDLYRSHGYPALQVERRDGRDAALLRFPCALPVLEASLGIIFHSSFALRSLARHHPEAVVGRAHVVPLLAYGRPVPNRASARRRLSVADDVLLICSFGLLTPNKMPELLLEAWQAMRGNKGQLVFVGAPVDGFTPMPGSDTLLVRVTGRVDGATYDDWLAAADFAVQLRAHSHGETSGAMIDCLAASVPLVVNDQGSASELPGSCVLRLPDQPGATVLRDALERLRDTIDLRTSMRTAGRAFVDANLHPVRIAAAYRDAIEAVYASTPNRAADSLVRLASWDARDRDLDEAARSMAASLPGHEKVGRLLVDMSELARRNVRSGIQRVVREVGSRLLAGADDRNPVEAVRFDRGALRHAYGLGSWLLGCPALQMAEVPADYSPTDTLLCLDPNPEMTEAEFADLRRRKLAGLRIVVVVYDLLPMLRPDFFPDGIHVVSAWYKRMLGLADQAICISRAVANELAQWLDGATPAWPTVLPIDYFHLGGDFATEITEEAEPNDEFTAAMAGTARRPSFLMVGTLEPRKGCMQALAAFDRLWSDGADVGLVMVGKQGWHMEPFIHQLARHPQLGVRLHWVRAASDADLRRLYTASTCLLMPSEGEGFGLPLVEAARTGLPILARDIPVFREVAGAYATYFSGKDATVLAAAVGDWLSALKQRNVPSSTRIHSCTWDEAVGELLDRISKHRQHRA